MSEILNLQWKRRKIRLSKTAKRERGRLYSSDIYFKGAAVSRKKSDPRRVRMNKKNT